MDDKITAAAESEAVRPPKGILKYRKGPLGRYPSVDNGVKDQGMRGRTPSVDLGESCFEEAMETILKSSELNGNAIIPARQVPIEVSPRENLNGTRWQLQQ